MTPRILVLGLDLRNQGSHLMLLSAIDALSRRVPGCEVCISPLCGTPWQRHAMGARTLAYPVDRLGHRRRFWLVHRIAAIARPLLLRSPVGVGLESITAILDLSGFAYTDSFGVGPARNLLMLLDTLPRRPFIMMPQAFGPLELPENRANMAEVLQISELCFARDQQSYDHLASLEIGSQRLRIAPDITLAYAPTRRQSGPNCCVVPNSRMLAEGRKAWGGDYLRLLSDLIDDVIKRTALTVLIMVHDRSGKDGKIARLLARGRGKRVRLMREPADPVDAKTVLASCCFVVSSRYHALASSLASGVPCISLAWSHKYQALMDQFGLGAYNFDAPSDSIVECAQELADSSTNVRLRAELEVASVRVCAEIDDAWSEVKARLALPLT